MQTNGFDFKLRLHAGHFLFVADSRIGDWKTSSAGKEGLCSLQNHDVESSALRRMRLHFGCLWHTLEHPSA